MKMPLQTHSHSLGTSNVRSRALRARSQDSHGKSVPRSPVWDRGQDTLRESGSEKSPGSLAPPGKARSSLVPVAGKPPKSSGPALWPGMSFPRCLFIKASLLPLPGSSPSLVKTTACLARGKYTGARDRYTASVSLLRSTSRSCHPRRTAPERCR